MKNILLTAAIAVAFTTNAQTILTLQPGPEEGKDAKIWSVGASYAFSDAFNLTGEYIKADENSAAGEDDGYVVG